MRPIKYLAFNGKELVPVISLDSMKDGEPIVLVSEDGSGDLPLKNLGKVPVYEWTGLKDKNGVEVYEGHVVRFHYFYASLGENMGVSESEHELTGVLSMGAFGWGLNAISGQHWKGYSGYDNGEGSASMLDLCSMAESEMHEESFELLGHISTNPELLK